MLNHTELNNLELIEQFWKENPDADSGIISADGKRIEPWYSQVKKVS